MVDLKNEKVQLRALETLFQQRRFTDALTLAEQLAGDFPSSYYINILHVKVLKELGRIVEAEEKARKLMALFPDNINLLVELGTACLKLNKIDDAIEFFNKILFLDPFNAEAKNAIEKIDAMAISSPGGEVKSISEDTVPELDGSQLAVPDISLDRDMASPEDEDVVENEETPDVGPIPPPAGETEEEISGASQFPDIGEIPEAEEEIPEFEPPQLPDIDETPEAGDIPVPGLSQVPGEVEVPGFEDAPAVAEPESVKIPGFEMEPEAADTGSVPELEVEIAAGAEELPGTLEIPEIPEIGEIADAVEAEESFPVPGEGYEEETVESLEDPIPQEPSPEIEAGKVPGIPRAETAPPEDEVAEDVVEEKDEEKDAGETEFVTESAAELYMSQGLYEDALKIYERLYNNLREERFLLKIKQLNAHRLGQRKIHRLNELLAAFQKKGEKIV